MAKDKKSFLLYCDLIHTVKKMPKEKAGELFLHILEYTNDQDPTTEDLVIQLTFEPIKQQLKRDLAKYEGIRQKNSENAKKRWSKKQSGGMRPDAKNADSDSDNDSDNVSDSENDSSLKKEPKKYIFRNHLLEFLFEPKLVDEWIQVRKKKKATNSETAAEDFLREVDKAFTEYGFTNNQVLKMCVIKSWSGFKCSWLKGEIEEEAKTTNTQDLISVAQKLKEKYSA